MLAGGRGGFQTRPYGAPFVSQESRGERGEGLGESAWRRGWHDTKRGWKSWPFLLWEVVVSPVAGVVAGVFNDPVIGTVVGVALVLIGLVSVWAGATASAPFKQRNEARQLAYKARKQRDTLSLWIREMGSAVDPLQVSSLQKHVACWYFDVNIANRSPDKPLGIRSVVLEIRRGDTVSTLRAIQGEPFAGTLRDAPKGEIPNSFRLEPEEPISGYLVFPEERWSDEDGDTYDSTVIMLIDSQDKEYRFPTDPRVNPFILINR